MGAENDLAADLFGGSVMIDPDDLVARRHGRRARRSLKRKTRLIISCSPSSNTPALVPSCNRTEISSCVTGGSGRGRIPGGASRDRSPCSTSQSAAQPPSQGPNRPGNQPCNPFRPEQRNPSGDELGEHNRQQVIDPTIKPTAIIWLCARHRDGSSQGVYQPGRQVRSSVDPVNVPSSVVDAWTVQSRPFGSSLKQKREGRAAVSPACEITQPRFPSQAMASSDMATKPLQESIPGSGLCPSKSLASDQPADDRIAREPRSGT